MESSLNFANYLKEDSLAFRSHCKIQSGRNIEEYLSRVISPYAACSLVQQVPRADWISLPWELFGRNFIPAATVDVPISWWISIQLQKSQNEEKRCLLENLRPRFKERRGDDRLTIPCHTATLS